MTLPMKDSNEMLQAGKSKEFINAFFRAAAYVPSGIVGSDQLLDKIKEAAVVPKIPLPPFMHRLQNLMAGGIPLGVTLCLGSASGQGKSTFVEEITHYMIFNSPHRVGVVSLESDCAQYGTKLLSRHIGKKIDLIDDDNYKIEFLNSEEIQQKSEELFKYPDGTPRFHLIEERDGSLESMKDLIMQLVVSCDCRVIILDPLQDLLDAQPLDAQSGFMSWIKGMMKSHGVTFILVNHLRKSSGGSKANSTGADIHEEDFMGHSSIFKSSACNLLFTRNKEAESEFERNVTTMKMTKCRWTGRTSPAAGRFYYDNDSHTLHDLDDWLINHPQDVDF
jgi:archaellum biogenesis ATPase FlaH